MSIVPPYVEYFVTIDHVQLKKTFVMFVCIKPVRSISVQQNNSVCQTFLTTISRICVCWSANKVRVRFYDSFTAFPGIFQFEELCRYTCQTT